MAHDSQIPAESSNDTSAPSKQSKTSPEVVADWLSVYAMVYREEYQEELILAYLEALKELKPGLLHQAFLHAMKRSRFRPTPAEVRESFAIIAEPQQGNRPKYLDEPKMSREEREKVLAEFPLKLGAETKINYQSMEALGFGLPHHHKASCLCEACRRRRNAVP